MPPLKEYLDEHKNENSEFWIKAVRILIILVNLIIAIIVPGLMNIVAFCGGFFTPITSFYAPIVLNWLF